MNEWLVNVFLDKELYRHVSTNKGSDNLLVKLAITKSIKAIRVKFYAKIVKQSGPNKSDQEGKKSQNS